MSWLFSRVLVEAYSEATSSDGEQYAPSKSTDTPQAYCAPDKMKAFSLLSRFGITFAPLTESLGEGLLTWYLADFHARTSAKQAVEQASKGNEVDCGRRWLAWFAKYDRATSSWKTAQRSLFEDLELYSETWPKSGTMRNGVCWEQVTLERRTTENEFGYWPTPCACMAKGSSDGALTRANGRDRTNDRLDHAVYALHRGRLNPTWVEWLMGWPLGWTDLRALEMARYHEWLQQHGHCCTAEWKRETSDENHG